MGYWVNIVEPKYPHREIDAMHMSISYNFSDMMMNLPCQHVLEWRGKIGADMTNPLLESIVELNTNPQRYEIYEKADELGSIENCKMILNDAYRLMKDNLDGIVDVE